jgi:hypothetical protein
MNRQDREYGFYRSSSTEKMSNGSFSAADVDIRSSAFAMFPEQEVLDSSILRGISQNGRSSVSVDIVDRLRSVASVFEGTFHSKKWTLTIFSWCSHVMCIGGKTIPLEFSVYACFASFGVLQFLVQLMANSILGYASQTSSTTTPAPSPITNPARSRSNGREACSGSSFQSVARLRALANPAIARGCMQDSDPPATITSASPKDIMRAASPRACAPVVQAVVAA